MGTTPDTVKRLVDRFNQQADQIRSPEYNETLIRIDFINPMMRELGWDIDNTAGYAEQYREVVHEDRIKVAGQTKAPDYSFRIGGVRKFFLEAKKPAVDIENNWEPAYQLRRYAWSAKLAVSILTDFEEFAIYDARVQPKQLEKASTARREFLRYTEYEQRWDFLSGTFSKDAVLRGEFDRYSESQKGRGAAPFDDAFLSEIEQWRKAVATSLARNNQSLDETALNFAVQRIIDRIIFLRIAEDRGTETVGQLQALLNGDNVYPRLVALFRRADERYNSGLFQFAKERERDEAPDTLTPTLDVDDKTLKTVVKALYYPQSPYEFTMVSADLLGSIYERFLGNVITLTGGHTARIVEKPEVRKAGGVYYTPTYIVVYIVQNTVGKLLEGKTPKEATKIKVLDAACGSGSFLIGAYEFLLDWYLQQYTASDPASLAQQKNAVIRPATVKPAESLADGRIIPGWALTISERKRILLDHIHGVDIDNQAVEVTKLNLLLKCLEGETSQTLGFEQRLFRERALPDLGKNIQCGNSLIGTDIIAMPAWGKLAKSEQGDINPFDYERAFPQVFPAKGKDVGFDAVIGNPPYVRVQRLEHSDIDYIYGRYRTPASKTDLSQIFMERSLELINNRGLVGFISTSQWMATDYGELMRAYLASSRQLVTVVNFGSLPVFAGVSTYPAIFILSRQSVPSLESIKVANRSQLSLSGIYSATRRLIDFQSLSNEPWNFAEFNLLRHLAIQKSIKWRVLSTYGHAYIGDLTGSDEAFVVTAEERRAISIESDVVFPYAYRGEEVERYALTTPNSFVIYPYEEGQDGTPMLIPPSEFKRRFPNAYLHLQRRQDKLIKRLDSRHEYATGDQWFRHLRPGSFNYIRPPKLIIKGIGRQLTVGLLGSDTVFNGANCPGLILDDHQELSRLLGILNSRLITYHMRIVCPPKLNGYIRLNATNINEIPIATSDDRLDARLRALVDSMLTLHKRLAAELVPQMSEQLQREIDATERQIDALVYQLYGLTDDEIAIVEEATR